MREGMNPQKQSKKISLTYQHRVIIVVYIPNNQEYYQGVFEVFKLCLNSLISTVNKDCAITVVNNASNVNVRKYIEECLSKGVIDTAIHHNENIGKMDALIGAARGTREPLITMTDVDILFSNGWQRAVENIFNSIPKTGSVSPVSVRTSLHYQTSSTLKDILLKRLFFKWVEKPENVQDHNRFVASFGQPIDNNESVKWPQISKNETEALLGSAHQVLTVRRSIIFATVPEEPSLTLLGNNSEHNYIDEPINRAGLYRLCTSSNYAYHMGNKTEQWMYDIQQRNEHTPSAHSSSFVLHGKPKPLSKMFFKLESRMYTKLFKIFYKSEKHKRR